MTVPPAADARAGRPDRDYFAGKTITLVAPGEPGSGPDVIFRAIAPVLGPLVGATVNVEDISVGGQIGGDNAVGDGPANGLSIGYIGMSNAIAEQAADLAGIPTPTVNFAVREIEMVGGIHALESVLVASAADGPKNIEALLTAKAPLSVLAIAGGSFTLLEQMLIAAYRADSLRLVTGYTNAAALAAGLQRGDGPVTGIGLVSLASLIAAGLARPLLLSKPLLPSMPIYAILKADRVPTLESLLQSFPPKTPGGRATLKALIAYENAGNTWIFVARGTPKPVVDTLSAAIEKVFKSPTVEAAVVAAGSPSGLIPADQAPAQISAGLRSEPQIARFLG